MDNNFTKVVYTWDYRMRWAPIPRPVERRMGGGAPYIGDAKIFLEDYTRAFEWFSNCGYDGVIIWGLLRDSHGGIKAVQELCRRAEQFNMRVIAGVGVNCYGGIYWDGDNPYNLEHWVQRHPELAAQTADGKPMIKQAAPGGRSLLCPSRPENLQWHLDGLRFLLEETPIRGIWYETGDYGMCACPECKARPGQVPPYSYADLAAVLPALMNRVHAWRKDVMQIAISYGNMPHYLSLNLGLVEKHLPEFAWYAWLFEGGVGWQAEEQAAWRSVVREPDAGIRSVPGRDIAFLAYNCYAGFDDGLICIERIHTACRMCRDKGIKGLMMMGELAEPSNLINYIAPDYFIKHPQANIRDCLEYALSRIKLK